MVGVEGEAETSEPLRSGSVKTRLAFEERGDKDWPLWGWMRCDCETAVVGIGWEAAGLGRESAGPELRDKV